MATNLALQLQVIEPDTDLNSIMIGNSQYSDDVWDLRPFITAKSTKESQKYIRFETKAIWWVQLIKVAVGLALVVAIKSGLKAPLIALIGHAGAANAVRYGLMVLFAGAVWPLAFPLLRKLEKT